MREAALRFWPSAITQSGLVAEGLFSFHSSFRSCYTVLGTKGSTTLPKLLRFHYDHVSEQDAHWNTVIGRDPIDRFYVEKKL